MINIVHLSLQIIREASGIPTLVIISDMNLKFVYRLSVFIILFQIILVVQYHKLAGISGFVALHLYHFLVIRLLHSGHVLFSCDFSYFYLDVNIARSLFDQRKHFALINFRGVESFYIHFSCVIINLGQFD